MGMHVLLHGGAGTAPENPDARQAVLDDAARTGAAAADPQTAVVESVRRLESDPRFNAGVGSAVQSDGTIRTDAGVMTDDGEAGAAGAMPGVEHAVDVARVVKTETPHVCLAGERAVALADAFDVETACDLWTDRTRERWTDADPPTDADTRTQLAWVHERFGDAERDHDTVGAVATDGQHLAAATSTGGRWFALAGRVGDVPQVGAGFHATPRAAVSTTGDGEAIAYFALARRVADAIEDGETPQHAVDRVVRGFSAATDASAGIVAIDADGRRGVTYTTDAMQTSVVTPQ